MQKTMDFSLNVKLFSFVGIASFLVLIAVGTGFFFYSRIEAANGLKKDVNIIVEKVLTTRLAEKTYLQFFLPDQKKQFDAISQDVVSQIHTLERQKIPDEWKTQINTIGTIFEKYQHLFAELDNIHIQQNHVKSEMIKPLQTSHIILTGIINQLQKKRSMLEMAGDELSVADKQLLDIAKDSNTDFILLQNLQLQYLLTGDSKYIMEYKKLAVGEVKDLTTTLEQISSASQNVEMTKTSSIIKESLGKFTKFIEESQKLYSNEKEQIASLDNSGQQILETANKFLTMVEQSIAGQRQSMIISLSLILTLGFIGFWTISFILVRSIGKPIQAVIEGLTESAEQVASGSAQISTASQELAENASKQAASIEETSASIEELSSMTKQNADNAQQANQLMTESRQTIVHTHTSMEQLTAAMREISSSSEETQKIVKTIDEIAFQTNLLALNAAVEAARAGEAGAGFAVVADEVRNLSKRAAEAARNTSSLIEMTVATIHKGAGMVENVNSEFGCVLDSASKVEQLVNEIASASREQAVGIEQINTSVSDVDATVQQNAANAEESASASAEMNGHAGQLKAFVDRLVALIEGGSHQAAADTSDETTPEIEEQDVVLPPTKVIPYDRRRKSIPAP